MAIPLDGGVLVVGLREGAPVHHPPLRVWRHVGRETGAQAISLRVLEVAPGTSPGLRSTVEDVLYVLEGAGAALLDGAEHALVPDTGLFLRPGVRLTLVNPGPEAMTLLSVQCPDPGPRLTVEAACLEPSKATGRAPVVRLADRRSAETGDRWYRVLVDAEVGSTNVTQFVGGIPPGRAPDHFHEYEELLCILAGTGRVWAGERHAKIGRGSCIYLPRRQPHCLENTGRDELRLAGVFHPAGSPAVRYPA